MTNEKDREEALLDLEREAWDIYMLMEFDNMGELASARRSAEWIERRDNRIRAEAVKAERERVDTKLREALCSSPRIFVTSSGEIIHLDEACKIVRSVILSDNQEARNG